MILDLLTATLRYLPAAERGHAARFAV